MATKKAQTITLVNRIGELVCQIHQLEKELDTLHAIDVYQDMDEEARCSLWSNIGLPEKHVLSCQEDPSMCAEFPCYAAHALLEPLFQTIPQSVLHKQGCYIQIQGKTVRMNISLSTSVEKLAQALGCHQLHVHRTK